jgi:lambda repressor-like predicted transcriptional regulator
MVIRQFSKTDIEIMQRLRNAGLSYREIGERFGVSVGTARYFILPKERKQKNINAKKNYKKLKELWGERNKKWRRANPDKYKKSICLSLLKGYLRRGIVTKEDVLDVVLRR